MDKLAEDLREILSNFEQINSKLKELKPLLENNSERYELLENLITPNLAEEKKG